MVQYFCIRIWGEVDQLIVVVYAVPVPGLSETYPERSRNLASRSLPYHKNTDKNYTIFKPAFLELELPE